MKFGFRTPSLRRRIAARTSLKRYVRHSLGIKAPRGWGWLTNPKRAAYNRIYYRTTFGINDLFRPRRRRRRASSGCLLMLVALLATMSLTALAIVHRAPVTAPAAGGNLSPASIAATATANVTHRVAFR